MSQKLGADFTNLTIVRGKVNPRFYSESTPHRARMAFFVAGKKYFAFGEISDSYLSGLRTYRPAGRISLAPAPMPDGDLQQRIAARINAYKKREQN